MPIREFKEKLKLMSMDELQALSSDISGTIVVIESSRQTALSRDQTYRATRALGYAIEKRNAVSSRLQSHHAKNGTKGERRRERRVDLTARARKAFHQGDPQTALGLVIEWLEAYDSDDGGRE